MNMNEHQGTPAVIVGIDGSRSAIDAALWAVDEAVKRDVPLRLVYAIDPDAATDGDKSAARDLAAAELAVRQAFVAVESTEKPVKIEIEIFQDKPIAALRQASRWASMLCVGSMGLAHTSRGRIGSTATALATSAHCPVVIVHSHERRSTESRWVVAEITESPGSDNVLRRAVEEARLRDAPLHVLTTWQSTDTDDHRTAVSEGNRLGKARLDRRLAGCKSRHPDLDIQAVTVHGSIHDFLAEHIESVQLLVVAHNRAHGIAELIGPPAGGQLRNNNCSVLICEPQNVL